MSDLLERLAAANPVPDAESPSIAEVWCKVAERDAQPRSRRRRRWRRLPRGAGRVSLTLAAVIAPIIVVLALAIPLHGVRPRLSRPTAPGTVRGKSSLDPAAQRVAALALAGRAGSVVALDPRTGAIKVMLTNLTPGGNPRSGAAAGGVRYAPEATFDIVTAAAALDSGRYTPTSSVGPVTLTQALSLSVNTVFAKVGETVGRGGLTTYMRRFGFYAPLRLAPASAPLPASGVRLGDQLVMPTSPRVDLRRLAAGQSKLVATPLQMAMIAAAVADQGKLMAPQLETVAPSRYAQVMQPSTARALTQMMSEVVRHGTGVQAGVTGVQVAGKTGTAHVGGTLSKSTDLWFIGFAPANDPKIAIAVALSDVNGGYGGTQAAPIAARVIQRLLGEFGRRPPRR